MKRQFVKMHGIGNDFVLLDAGPEPPSPDRLRWIADRRRGIGCDQVLLVEPRGSGWGYRIYNADGSPAGQCGNGARCIARYLFDRGRIGREATLQGPSGAVAVTVHGGGRVSVDLGPPRLAPESVPFHGPTAPEAAAVNVDGETVRFHALSMGNPHAVRLRSGPAPVPLERLAAALQADPRFPAGVNVGDALCLDRTQLELRVVERGAGETLACGSGACAAVVAGRLAGQLGEEVRVRLPGGELEIRWPGAGQGVIMTGPAQYAFEGAFDA